MNETIERLVGNLHHLQALCFRAFFIEEHFCSACHHPYTQRRRASDHFTSPDSAGSTGFIFSPPMTDVNHFHNE